MQLRRTLLLLSAATVAVVLAVPAHAAKISGAISATLAITEDSQLTGNVTCTVDF
jgi:hypothetical protein